VAQNQNHQTNQISAHEHIRLSFAARPIKEDGQRGWWAGHTTTTATTAEGSKKPTTDRYQQLRHPEGVRSKVPQMLLQPEKNTTKKLNGKTGPGARNRPLRNTQTWNLIWFQSDGVS
jgi:hypothetical protein